MSYYIRLVIDKLELVVGYSIELALMDTSEVSCRLLLSMQPGLLVIFDQHNLGSRTLNPFSTWVIVP
jgi:hypothetical protein